MADHAAGPRSHAAFQRRRDRLVAGLRGTVLEVGAGRGRNFSALAPEAVWIGLEPDDGRRRALAAAALRHGHPRPPLDARAERIPLPDDSVTAVLSTYVLCSVGDPERALGEFARVLAPGGVLVFAEHVAAPPGTAKHRVQRLVAPLSRALDHGCDPARDTAAVIARSALRIAELESFELPALFGVTVPHVLGRATAPRPARPDPRAPGGIP